MENSHNAPKCVKNYENDNMELIYLIVQLQKDLFIIQNDFYKFWHHCMQVINKNKNDTFFFAFFIFYIFVFGCPFLTCMSVFDLGGPFST